MKTNKTKDTRGYSAEERKKLAEKLKGQSDRAVRHETGVSRGTLRAIRKEFKVPRPDMTGPKAPKKPSATKKKAVVKKTAAKKAPVKKKAPAKPADPLL